MRVRCTGLLVAAGLLTFGASAHAYVLLGSPWDVDEGPIVFYLAEEGSDDISDGSDLDAARSAFRSWGCVEGSRLRVLEGSEPGPAELSLEDGINTFFWDETGQYGLGPATLGVTVGDAPMSPDQPIVRSNADIVMNGFDHTWRTEASAAGVDVESVAVHEAGHWFGLGHPCTDEAETDCLGPDQAVMTPALPDGAIIREPFEDDQNGILEMYPQDEDDESTCDGPFRQGEPCACNDECVAGLKCTIGDNQEVAVCTPNCGTSAALCPSGFACVLAARGDAENADGACVQVAAEGAPPAAVCERDSDCAEGLCLASSIVGRAVCQTRCETAADCPDGYACTEELCTGAGATDGLACPEVDAGSGDMPMPACSASIEPIETSVPAAVWALICIPLIITRRRSRQR